MTSALEEKSRSTEGAEYTYVASQPQSFEYANGFHGVSEAHYQSVVDYNNRLASAEITFENN